MNNLESFWLFLSGAPVGYVVAAALVLVGLLLLTVVFQAACALADVPTPSFLYSLLIVLVTLALQGVLNSALVYGYSHSPLYDFLPGWVSTVLLALMGFVVCVAIAAALFMPILRISAKKSLLTGVFEQLLGLLLFSLVYGAVLVVLAIVQIATKQPPNKAAQALPALPAVAVVVPS